jgi:hypothetical protein
VVDFVKLAATANKLVAKNGRSVVFNKLGKTPADPAFPWEGPADPRSPIQATVTARGSFVEPDNASRLGFDAQTSELVKQSQQIMIVGQPTTGETLEDFDEVVDGAETWKITLVTKLKPADVTLLYFVGLKK